MEAGQAQTGVVIFSVLAQFVLATVHSPSRDIKAGGPYVFCIDVFFFQRLRVHEFCQRGDRHSPFPSRLEASDPDARQPTPSCALQTPRSRSLDCRPCIVLSRTALDETALSLPACTQRSICHGAALASRLDPLAFSGYKHGRSKALFRCAQRNIDLRSRTRQIIVRPRELGLRTSNIRTMLSPLVSAAPLVLQSCCCSTGIPHAWRTIFATLRTPTRVVTIPHSLP